SAMTINLICGGITGAALLAGEGLRRVIPGWLTAALCFVILTVLGIAKLLDSATKALIRKRGKMQKELHFSMLNFRFILRLYANPEEADADHSMDLSPAESVSLAVALSLDSVTVGLGAAIGRVNWIVVLAASLVANLAAIIIGCLMGNKIARKTEFDLSWLSGAILIIIAFSKLF
ncbi:MAG: manganese efflux pump, partial [Oscillospiraceae bacterium]|nr:manganese efflux pump [Oscillospiraceae bacterium]